MQEDEEHAGSAEHLSGRERRQVAANLPPTALVVHEIIREAGEEELERTNSSLLWSGLAAGLSMGFNLVCLGLLKYHLPDAQWTPLIQSFGYTVGFIIVILGRQQLFTENTITSVIPLLTRRTLDCLLHVARIWALVLLANLVGTAIFAALAFHAPLTTPDLHEPFLELSLHAVEGGFIELASQGVLAGWLIALMVWLLPAAGSARVLVILLITYVIGLGGFAHIIAGSTEAFYAVFAGELSFADYLFGYFVPVLLGNVVGGTALVAIVNHAQVRDEVTGEEQRQ
ncbi:MAG: formate/nitrite transporter family protein, partial [Geminicoccaceae bacterium]|nr:formate/nitrite transporter family protein [Geminicoccaceae bacterium]